MADPGQGALDDPALGDDLEAGNIVAFDDFQSPFSGLGHPLGHDRSLVAGIGEDHLDEREEAAGLPQQSVRPIAVLHGGGVNRDSHHQAERIDHDVPLATGDLFARVIPLRVDRGPPFCAARALWLSMIAAEGLASRPACSRHLT